MRSSPGPPLPASVSAALARLEARLGQAADPWARSLLAELDEAAAARVVRSIADPPRTVWNLSAYIRYMVEKEATLKRNAEGVPTAESAACVSGPSFASQQDDSVSGPFYQDDAQMEVQSPDTEMALGLSTQARMEPLTPVRQMPCGFQYHEMEVQIPDTEMALGLSTQARVEPVSPVRQMPCGFQYHEMEVEGPPCSISPRLPNQQSPFSKPASPMASRGVAQTVCLKHQMPHCSTRDLTPSPVRDITKRVRQMNGPSGRVGVAPPPSFATMNELRAKASPEMIALGELDFDRFFLIRAYLADKKIEEELKDVNYIRYLKSLPMDRFESEIWNKFGNKSIPSTDRRKNLDWDTSKTRLYHCNIEKKDDSIVTTFKGPFMENTRTHLQKCLGDDNVLIVKFTDIPGHMNHTDKFGIYCTYYNQVSEDGIILGLRRYRFFIFKDGGKEEKLKEERKKERKKHCVSSVRCYFIRTESGWDRDEPYILSNKTLFHARRLFMHIHTAPTVAKYLSRFALILSKTVTLDLKFSEVNVTIIDDKPCMYEDGTIAERNEEPLIHTDGTGLISLDLALKCPTGVFKGNFSKAHDLENTLDSKKHRYLIPEHPLLMQMRLFYNGCAVKGTLLVDARLPERTIHIRPSMIKINTDPVSSGSHSFNSLEIVTTSNRPKRAVTSRFLISLLHYGRVPADYFLELLGKALKDINKACHTVRDSLEVAFNHADLDDSMSARMILSGIQPQDEAYLQSQLDLMTKEERKGIKQGKIPIDKCYYLMGTVDPTGTLKPDQVCVILDEGQLSGKVLVYKHPGLHFGDIHVLTATYVDGLEEIVGDSKYAIFFPTCGPRSLADEMANSDFDGDMYWVSINTQLLKHFEPSAPWVQRIPPNKGKQKKPQEYDGSKLESLLFLEFLRCRFTPSCVLGTAANCWLTLMDRLLTPGVSEREKKSIEADMLVLVDIYYLASDAPKQGNKINVPEYLLVKKYPHFLEREPSYHSISVLGMIYDEVTLQQSEQTTAPIQISPLKCFTEEGVSEEHKQRWTCLYNDYLGESSSLCKLTNKEEKNIKFRELYQKYKRILYHAEEFDESPRRGSLDLFQEVCAIYQVVYGRAMPGNEVNKCGFAWKVAGRALCQLYALKCGGDTVLCSLRAVADAFRKNRA